MSTPRDAATYNEFERLGPQEPYMAEFRRQQSLEGSFQTGPISPTPRDAVVARAEEIFFGTLDAYSRSTFCEKKIHSTESPLFADALLHAFHEFSPNANGKTEILRT